MAVDTTEVARKRVRDSRKYLKLRSLPCFPEVYKLLCDGYPFSQVSAFIQNEHGEYSGIQQRSLTQLLQNFYEEGIPDDQKVSFPEAVEVKKQKRVDNFDPVEEAKALYFTQLARVQIATTAEETNNLLMQTTGKEIKIASDLLTRLAKLITAAAQEGGESKTELERGARLSIDAEEATGIESEFLQDPVKRQQLLELVQALRNAPSDVILGFDNDEEEVDVEEVDEVQVPA
jgi:hypothetical protein